MSDGPDYAIYRSNHPNVLRAWEEAKAAKTEWNERVKKQLIAWGFDNSEVMVSEDAWGPARLIGVHHMSEVPSGWRRLNQGSGYYTLVPYRSKPKAVPEVVAAFDALVKIPDIRSDLVPYGMPYHMFTGLSVSAPALVRDGDYVWAKWSGTDPLASDQWWEKIELSRYYKMVEGGHDPFAKTDETDPE